mmetsp:Transcript_28468/g.68460  ORF Transcript_28468/g.68460 Transcript_28468/m.68460 type:complete len:439 (-) Transcript_28468:60-1376(-)
MAARDVELRGIVDEDPEEVDPVTATIGDLDVVFAYRTMRIVRIKDKSLGLLYWTIVGLIISYIFIFALMIEGKHQQQEVGSGTVVTKVKGKAFGTPYPNKDNEPPVGYDVADLRYPEIDPQGAFIATKITTVKEQQIGECIDFDSRCPCRTKEKCKIKPPDGDGENYCYEEKAWCPSLGIGNVDKVASGDVPNGNVMLISGIENMKLEIHAAIAFPNLGNRFYVAGKSNFLGLSHESPIRNISVGALLAMADPPLYMEDLQHTGAFIGVSVNWNCNVDDSDGCEPLQIVVQRLDSGDGFTQKRSKHYQSGGTWKRDATICHGLRILVDSSGIGRSVSLMLAVIQIGSCLALLRTAAIIADALMLSAIYSPNRKKREAYYKCKVQETADYSDLKDRLNLIHDQAEETKKLLLAEQKGKRTGPAGGGIASTILQRRAGPR